MKTILCLLILFVNGIIYPSPGSGQNKISDFDTVIVTKPDFNIPSYKFFYYGEKEIRYDQIVAELVHYKTDPILKDLGNGILTIVTGIGFSTTTDVNWKVSGKVTCKYIPSDWTVNLFCEGNVEKERERVANDDGSKAVVTNEINIFYWDRNASGILIENIDTIGYFSIIMNPCENKLLSSWCSDIFPWYQSGKNSRSKIKVDVFWKPSPENDYGIIGKFRNKDFILIRNGLNRRIWIIKENMPGCIFQSDLNYPGISKKYRIQPYFLIDPDIPEQDRSDFFRLAMVSKILDISFKLD